jgi:hypothetical protein
MYSIFILFFFRDSLRPSRRSLILSLLLSHSSSHCLSPSLSRARALCLTLMLSLAPSLRVCVHAFSLLHFRSLSLSLPHLVCARTNTGSHRQFTRTLMHVRARALTHSPSLSLTHTHHRRATLVASIHAGVISV